MGGGLRCSRCTGRARTVYRREVLCSECARRLRGLAALKRARAMIAREARDIRERDAMSASMDGRRGALEAACARTDAHVTAALQVLGFLKGDVLVEGRLGRWRLWFERRRRNVGPDARTAAALVAADELIEALDADRREWMAQVVALRRE